jgi:hypothetical protein
MPWNPSIVDSQILAVHAALVPSGDQGEVVLFGGDEHWADQQESAGGDKFKKTRVYDVRTHSIVSAAIPSPDSDVFCAHHAFAADGRLLIAGGTSKWPEGGDGHVHNLDFLGHRRCWLYNPRGRKWVEVSRLRKNPDQEDEEESGGRWYPGCVTLGNGDVLALFGHLMQKDFRHRNTLPERYNQAGNTWVNLPKEMAFPLAPGPGVRYLFYPRVFTLRDGKLFFATPMPVEFDTAASGDGTYFSTLYDPATGDYEGHKIPEPGSGGYLDWSRPAVLLPLLPEEDYRPRVLFCGDTGALKIDLGVATPAWQATSARAASVAGLTRQYSNAAILPNGQVCLVGGVNVVEPESPVLQAEIYDPGIDWGAGAYANPDAWSVKESAVHTRNYHSTALLLPNGKVWVAGGNVDANSGDPDTVGVKKIELYEPDYIAVANRIQVTAAPRFLSYGDSFELEIDRPATNVGRVALVRGGSVTHSTNNDQRYVGLRIGSRNGNTLTVVAPPSGNVAPPGYYMLWVMDTAGNPCQLARFVRLAHVGCSVVTDRSTFSEEEIASLGGGGQATINHAVYVYFDGFIDTELTGNPTFALTWADTAAAVPASQMTLVPAGRLLEVDPGDPDVPQRITFPFHVRFPNTSAWSSVVDKRLVRLTFTLGSHTCTETVDLTKSPNPYMTDVDPATNNPHWLSTDVRVFATVGGMPSHGGVTQGTGPDAGPNFIKGVLDAFNAAPANASHPFLSIPTAQDSAPLVLATDIFGIPFFNYAVAKVRYRANTTVAQRVKVFFRLFNTVGTALEYNAGTTYRHTGPGAGTVPLLGSAGGELISIPFFLSPRVETVQGRAGAASMNTHTLDAAYEVKDITPTPGVEVTMYFGCWLDINRTRKLFPMTPGGSDGPWPESSCRSIQELLRGRHQCLVAEVYFEPDATAAGETPGSSDNLSQRNLAILFSDNPGGPDSRVLLHTFEVKPSALPKLPPQGLLEAVPLGLRTGGVLATDGAVNKRFAPDELFFRWHNLPADSEVTVFFSDVDAEDIRRLAATRLSPAAFEVVNKNTIRFTVADATWMPLPGGRQIHIPALLSIKLPAGVLEGQTYRVSVHQVDGRTGQVIGAFELAIPVSKAELILEDEVRTLSVLKHIATTIPPSNRWYPIFQRYVHGLGKKVDALGGDSGTVYPNPNGSGEPYVPPAPKGPGQERCPEGWVASLVVALALLGFGLVGPGGAGAVLLVASVVVLALVLRKWSSRCCGRNRCAMVDHFLLGSGVAAAGLGLLLPFRAALPFVPVALVVSTLLAAALAVLGFAWRCRGGCCDDQDDGCRPRSIPSRPYPYLPRHDTPSAEPVRPPDPVRPVDPGPAEDHHGGGGAPGHHH